MDAVITYVNGLDPVWQKDYETYNDIPPLTKRYRDWGTLKYLLRGIEVNMPFINNVFLVVSHESQVPDWVNRNVLKVVLHKDIIPAEFLPTFNSTTIEMFLHRITGLDEQYLYFNDDTFPVSPCKADDFFREGKGIIGFSKHIFALGMYKKQCLNSDRFAREALGLPKPWMFIRPQHICTPMLRSECCEAFAKMEDKILPTLSRLRTDKNLNQYFFLDYMYYRGTIVPQKLSNKHFSLAMASERDIISFLLQPTRKMCCINDVHLKEDKYLSMRQSLISTLSMVLSDKSKYEI